MGQDDLQPSARPDDPEAWLAQFAGRLPRHHEVLRHLVEGTRRDSRVVQLSVGCSVGRGTADELSDLDCELSLEPDAWPSGLELIEPLVRSAGDIVDLIHHRWHEAGAAEHRRTAVVYDNGIQLDLMVWPVTAWSGMHPPDTIVLHATRDVFTHPWDAARSRPTADRLHEWHFLGWWALLDADKYLRRGSLWEARQRLEEARAAVWQLHAAAQKLPFPEYGITTLLDAREPRLMPDVEATATDLDAGRLRMAVERCAALLEAEWVPATAAISEDTEKAPPRLAPWALHRLAMPATSLAPATAMRRDVERWTLQAENWLAWARTPGHDAYWVYAPEFFDAVVPAAGRRTLELGCGEGRVARDLTRRGHRVVAVDVTATLLRHATDASTGEAYVLSSAPSLPFTTASFDLIVAYNSLMDVDDMPGALHELGRVLQPAGRLCICVTHPLSDAGRFTSGAPDAPFVIDGSYLAGGTFEGTFERNGLRMTFSGRMHTFESYSRALEAAGLVIERVREPPMPEDRVRDAADRRWGRIPMFLFIGAVKR